jgi:hypothetical protein
MQFRQNADTGRITGFEVGDFISIYFNILGVG